MSKKIYLKCFQTGKGGSVAQITLLRYRRLAGIDKQSMTMWEGVEVWFTWDRSMSDSEATKSARAYARLWDLNGRPKTSDLRKAMEQGRAALWADEQ